MSFKKRANVFVFFFPLQCLFYFGGRFFNSGSVKIKAFGKNAEHRALLQTGTGRCAAEKLLLEIKQVLELDHLQLYTNPDLSEGWGKAVWTKLKGKPPRGFLPGGSDIDASKAAVYK